MFMFVGITLAFVFIILAMIIGGGLGAFIDVPSFLIVIGGTAAATIAKFPPKDVGKGFKTAMLASKGRKDISDLNQLVDTTEELLKKTRKEGLISIEGQSSGNDFYDDGLAYMLAAPDAKALERYLSDQIQNVINQAQRGKAVLDALADAAPAFGMIGTVIGLILMLGNLDDPSTIGPSLAVALLTTLYGAIVANAAFIPMAEKISSWQAVTVHEREMIAICLMYIKNGESPMIMREAVKPYLTHDFYKLPEV
ncbi:MotA/TolQ/ExbB proton channel family protein [Thiomicrospira microaerophila]|uniref:motility protein A n=1 Tax=Thiomicrospira microaerophila TaxID=406020 RepID=UPI00200FBD42|nr:MotA/TolQ/ExbB proton channel family protein [Thiomicrospira microaerophila]UQB42330.1 MotA/TolQ/ExbB proton channel family protein [Thiomicrospira microaerophila]